MIQSRRDFLHALPEAQWPLQLISYKSPLQNSYSIGVRSLRGLHPDNPVAVHPEDAARLGVQRGVLAVEHGFGHREFGARAHRIGGKTQPREAAIGAGINLNDLGLSDPTRSGRNVFVDPVAGTTVPWRTDPGRPCL